MTIYLVGSGPVGSDATFGDFVASARKRGDRIAICLLGSEDESGQYLGDYADPIRARFPDARIEPVWLVGEATVWPDAPPDLAGIIVAGGWTPGYLDNLLPHRDLIARLVLRGSAYLGFSAGAHVASRRAIVGGWKHKGRQLCPEDAGEDLEDLTVRDGLGLVSITVQAHTDRWGTLPVAMAAVEAGLTPSAVAIDEETTLVIDPVSGRTRVQGPGRIQWIVREHTGLLIRWEAALSGAHGNAAEPTGSVENSVPGVAS
ncbi:MAG TPA: hypothetical protein VLR88_03655 [Propionibacteriaceae bacterium]|nr:hypothetical protein [Propionibacteriaceae bacterium]